MKRHKVAVIHPRLLSGGSEARALWSIQALRAEYEVSLITCGPVDLQRLNAYYGTALAHDDFHLLRVPLLPGVTATRFNLLQGRLLQRYCQQVASQFEVMISTYNPLNFGVPGIQCIADFSFMPKWRFQLHPVLQNHRRWWYADSPLRRAYIGLGNFISRWDLQDMKDDLFVANSQWSAGILNEKLRIRSLLLYPPVSANIPDTPYEHREVGFVWLGNVIPEKRPDAVIEILRKVRERGHDVHLHIGGRLGESTFCNRIEQMAMRYQEWVFLENQLEQTRKNALIGRHRYGIQGTINESFGIAAAELVKGGCIVFVPAGGGQMEVVNHPNLMYDDDDDAVDKIDSVLRSPPMQVSLREHLAVTGKRFSTEVFARGILEITRDFIETTRGSGKKCSR